MSYEELQAFEHADFEKEMARIEVADREFERRALKQLLTRRITKGRGRRRKTRHHVPLLAASQRTTLRGGTSDSDEDSSVSEPEGSSESEGMAQSAWPL